MSDVQTTAKLALLNDRCQRHREYVSRQWQYFVSLLVLNGLLVSQVKDLTLINQNLVAYLICAAIITLAVFFHLINWTNIRIHRNAKKLNDLAKELAGIEYNYIELPDSLFGGISKFLMASTLFYGVAWFVFLFSLRIIDDPIVIGAIVIGGLIIAGSILFPHFRKQ